MADDYDALPDPGEHEPQEEEPEWRPETEEEPSATQPPTPDYRQFTGQPWWKRSWLRKYAFPAGVVAFAGVLMISRSKSVVQEAFHAANGSDTPVGTIRNNVSSGIRKPFQLPSRQQPQAETQQQEQNTSSSSGGGNDYRQQRMEEKRRHREEAFASPIFAADAPTSKPTAATRPEQPGVLDLLSGADLSGLSPQQREKIKRYLEVQQVLDGVPQTPALASGATPVSAPQPALPSTPNPQQAAYNARETEKERNVILDRAVGPYHRILPGTIVEAAIDTALESSMTGVVLAHFTRDVHTSTNPFGPVLIPAGSQLIGQAAPVTGINDQRMKVTFDLIVEPNGYEINLDQFLAMNQKGETGLADSVNNHWLRTIGVAVAVGVIEGLAMSNSGVTILSPQTQIYTGIASSAGHEGIHILDRFLNMPPTVKVNPGSRLRIVFPVGLDDVPEYRNTEMAGNL